MDRYEIDLQANSDWNKPSKQGVPIFLLYVSYKYLHTHTYVPAIVYGEPEAPPDQPSSEPHKLAESLILIELISTSRALLPKDRVKARFFVEVFSSKFIPAWHASATKGESMDNLLRVMIEVHQRLISARDCTLNASRLFPLHQPIRPVPSSKQHRS